MVIRMKKVRDGVVLSCLREGGGVDVQRTGHGGFFALHDLMHFAVETTLEAQEAFFGLMAAGWSFEAFSDKNDPRYATLPTEAIHVENLVGLLLQRLSDRSWEDPELAPVMAEDVSREMAVIMAVPLAIEAADLTRIFRRFWELAARWKALPQGEHLELEFPT